MSFPNQKGEYAEGNYDVYIKLASPESEKRLPSFLIPDGPYWLYKKVEPYPHMDSDPGLACRKICDKLSCSCSDRIAEANCV